MGGTRNVICYSIHFSKSETITPVASVSQNSSHVVHDLEKTLPWSFLLTTSVSRRERSAAVMRPTHDPSTETQGHKLGTRGALTAGAPESIGIEDFGVSTLAEAADLNPTGHDFTAAESSYFPKSAKRYGKDGTGNEKLSTSAFSRTSSGCVSSPLKDSNPSKDGSLLPTCGVCLSLHQISACVLLSRSGRHFSPLRKRYSTITLTVTGPSHFCCFLRTFCHLLMCFHGCI